MVKCTYSAALRMFCSAPVDSHDACPSIISPGFDRRRPSVFRRDNKSDSFEQQMGALRDQLGAEAPEDDLEEDAPAYTERVNPFGYSEARTDQFATAPEAPASPSIPTVDA